MEEATPHRRVVLATTVSFASVLQGCNVGAAMGGLLASSGVGGSNRHRTKDALDAGDVNTAVG